MEKGGGAAFDAAGQVSLPDGSAAENGGTQITVNGDGPPWPNGKPAGSKKHLSCI